MRSSPPTPPCKGRILRTLARSSFVIWAFSTGTATAESQMTAQSQEVDRAAETAIGETRDEALSDRLQLPPVRMKFKQDIEWGEFSGTDVTTFQSSVRAETHLPITQKWIVLLSSRYRITATEFGGNRDFIDAGRESGDPWDELHDFAARFRSRYALNDSWRLYAAAKVKSRFEEGASFGDGVTSGGAFAVRYAIGKKFSVATGVSVGSKMQGGGVNIRPLVKLVWSITAVHRLETVGIGFQFRSRWNRELTTYVFGRYQSSRWRLEDRDDGPDGVNKGNLRDRKIPIGIGLRWRFNKMVRLRGNFGLTVYRELRVNDQDNDEVDKDKMSAPGVFGSISAEFRF
jgi:hypothetical protein